MSFSVYRKCLKCGTQFVEENVLSTTWESRFCSEKCKIEYGHEPSGYYKVHPPILVPPEAPDPIKKPRKPRTPGKPRGAYEHSLSFLKGKNNPVKIPDPRYTQVDNGPEYGPPGKKELEKVCASCGKPFKTKDRDRRYCYDPCGKIINQQPRAEFFIYNRDNFTCIYCGKSSLADGIKLHADHIIPKSKGGQDIASNMVTACSRCNISKGDRFLNDDSEIMAIVAERNVRFGINGLTNIKHLTDAVLVNCTEA